MTDKDLTFDQEMMEYASELPPSEEEVRLTNPWSKPIGFITWGFILTTLHLNFLYLQYFLPTIGVILIYLGFRSLRNENGYFKAAWVMAAFRIILHLADLITTAGPIINGYPVLAAGTVMTGYQIAFFLIFRAALKSVYQKAGKKPESDPLLWVSVWTVAAYLIAISPLSQSWLAFIPMIIFYILIVISLESIGEELDDAGYVLRNARVNISNLAFGWTYFLIALVAVIGCCIYYNHLPLEPSAYQPPQTSEARQHLLDMDFPEEVLQYLSDDDVSLISGAKNIEAISELLMLDPTRVEHKETEGISTYINVTEEPGKENIEATTVYMEMPRNVIYIMQYFKWQGGKPIWQDGIQIAGENQAVDWQIVDSGLFYSRKGIDYTADFPRLVCDSMVQNGFFFGPSESVQITGAFSYPWGSKNQGGFVLYRYKLNYEGDTFATSSALNYLHLSSPIHLPYQNTEDRLLSGAYTFNDKKPQHYTSYDSLAYQQMGNKN